MFTNVYVRKISASLALIALALAAQGPVGAIAVTPDDLDPSSKMTPRLNQTRLWNDALADSLVNLTPAGTAVEQTVAVAREALAHRLADLTDGTTHTRNLTVSLRQQDHNLNTTLRLAGLVSARGGAPAPGADVLEEALSSRRAILSNVEGARLGGYFDQGGRNLQLVRSLPDAAGFGAAIEIARHAARAQADGAGLAIPGGAFVPTHALPSDALRAYLAAEGLAPTPAEDAAMRSLDALPAPVPARLAALVDAFAALDAGTTAAFAAADPARLEALWLGEGLQEDEDAIHAADQPPAAQWDQLSAAGVDVARLVKARDDFLGASVSFQEALAATPPAPAATCAPVTVDRPELAVVPFSIDLDDCANVYVRPTALVVDAAGNDVYHNNAGGNRLVGSCEEKDPLGQPRAPAAAALLDLAGNDARDGPVCGVNGGAALGVGVLLDAGGDDAYLTAGTERISGSRDVAGEGVNGGGHVGLGLLVDAAGADRYAGGEYGVNGGGFVGFGILVDAGSEADRYDATFGGVNGAGDNGLGFLYDAGGNDVYWTLSRASNGAGHHGVGMLVDEGGDDLYRALGAARRPGTGDDLYEGTTNGGGRVGVGFLYDAGGNDNYTGDRDGVNGGGWDGLGILVDDGGDDLYWALDNGTNGGGWGIQWTTMSGNPFETDTAPRFGVGILVDAWGRDEYHAGKFGVNGGCYISVSFLYDGGGDDLYRTNDGGGANGGAGGHSKAACVAFLLDQGGNDAYDAGQTWDFVGKGSNGGGANVGGVGFLMDASGHDVYRGHNVGVNGGAFMAVGMLLDAEGDDAYEADSRGVNGGAYGGDAPGGHSDVAINPATPGGIGFLVDLRGADAYTAKEEGANGGAFLANGFLYDGGGDDRYAATGNGTNGGGAGGAGLLVEKSGNDRYIASKPGVGGGATSASRGLDVPAGVGLLVDVAGADVYEDGEGGSGVDACVTPKGDAGVGAQRDLTYALTC